MNFSSRVSRIGESATLKVSTRAAELKAQGVEVIDLSAGEPDFPSPPVVVEAAKRALDEGLTRYTAAAGLPALREALAAKYRRLGAPWEAGQVVVTVGAKAALIELVLALFEEGDEVILPSPYWVSFPEQLRLAGATPVDVVSRPEEGFLLRAEPVLEALSDKTRGIILNSPCNPTGGVIEEADLERIVEACAEREVIVIADETYERFIYDGAAHASVAPLAARFPETVVLVGSFSKTYAMTGWRVGYALGPPRVMKAVNVIQSHSTSNATTFAMAGAIAALEEAEDDVAAMLVEYAARRDLTAELLEAIPGVTCRAPAGAFYAFPRVADLYGDGRSGSVAFSEHLLEKARVAVVPGVAFGNDDHVRISFACSRENIRHGLGRMAEALAQEPNTGG